MRKRAVKREFIMEIKKSANRFFSIFLIVALGVAFFSGIRASKPDMELSADRYFDESNLMDIRVLGTYGLTEEDRRQIENMDGIQKAEGSYTYDVLSYRENDQSVLKLQSFSEDMNKIRIVEGRYPKKDEECIIDNALAKNLGYHIGETIAVTSGNDQDISDYINRTEFKVVGIGTTPYYLSLERESSQIGNGSVNGFVMIPENNFCMDAYSEININVEGGKELVSYRPEYTDLVKKTVKKVENIKEERCDVRYHSVLNEGNDKIADAEIELNDAEKEANDKLDDGWKKIVKAKKDIKKGKLDIKDGEIKLKEGQKELEDGKKKVLDGESELNKGETDLKDGRTEYEDGKAELRKKKGELETGKKTITEKEAELAAARKEIEGKKAELEASKAYLSEPEYKAMLGEIEKNEQPLIEASKTLAFSRNTIEEGEKQYLEGVKKLEKAKVSLKKGEEKLEKSKVKIKDAKEKIKDAENTIRVNEKKLADAKKKIENGEKKLKKNEKKYHKEKKKAETKIGDAKEKIEDAKEEIADIEKPEWYVLGRDKMQVLAEYGQNAERIGAIGEVFPVIFFLVAALVCLTTMTRMVEEQRTQIGTLKALGYGKGTIATKYLLYAAIASITGGIFGTVIGQKVLPLAIIGAYRIMYVNLPYALAPFNFYYGLTSIAVVCLCTIFATYFSCAKEMRESAAQLMRPEAPKPGKRVLLERVGFIWKHISFTKKASIRNLFRYKKRFFMTIIGIAGCMALLLVGFGLRDSVYDIAILQYEKLFTYSGSITIKDGEKESKKEELLESVRNMPEVKKAKPIYETSVTISKGNTEKTAYLIVPEQEEDFDDYINLNNRLTHEVYELPLAGDGIILTEKAALLLGVSVGDVIRLKIDDTTKAEAKVRGIVENYALHYVYMLKGTYETLFHKTLEPNLLFFLFHKENQTKEADFGEKILEIPAASEILFCSETRKGIEDMLDSLDIVIWILIISAGLLAFVVLYNLNNININERKRELATLKVLGFYDKEVASYVYRENIMLSMIGTIVGIFLGIILHKFVILTAEIDVLMFGREIQWKSYIFSAGLTMIFSTVINWIMFYKLKKIDMVES
ncbi:MAG: FtsX-like permease family protein, partial [Acetivibrio sp.]